MAYIDQAYFATRSSLEIPAGEFESLAEGASDIIDALTMQRIERGGGLAALSEANQARVKKATAAQLETIYMAGGVDALTGGADLASASVGKFSYSKQAPAQTVGGVPVSPMIAGYLWLSGLLYRGLC